MKIKGEITRIWEEVNGKRWEVLFSSPILEPVFSSPILGHGLGHRGKMTLWFVTKSQFYDLVYITSVHTPMRVLLGQ